MSILFHVRSVVVILGRLSRLGASSPSPRQAWPVLLELDAANFPFLAFRETVQTSRPIETSMAR